MPLNKQESRQNGSLAGRLTPPQPFRPLSWRSGRFPALPCCTLRSKLWLAALYLFAVGFAQDVSSMMRESSIVHILPYQAIRVVTGKPFSASWQRRAAFDKKELSGKLYRNSAGIVRLDLEFSVDHGVALITDLRAGKQVTLLSDRQIAIVSAVEGAMTPDLEAWSLDGNPRWLPDEKVMQGIRVRRVVLDDTDPAGPQLGEAWVSPEYGLCFAADGITGTGASDSAETFQWLVTEFVPHEPEKGLFMIPDGFQVLPAISQ